MSQTNRSGKKTARWVTLLIAVLLAAAAIVYFVVLPKQGADKPADVTEIPAETEAPAEATEAPAEPTEAPAEATEAPAEATEAPAEATEAPAEATEAPAEPTEAPAEPTEAPAEATEAPAEAAEAPAQPTEAPAEAAEAPAEATEAPVLLATVNGEEIRTDNRDMQELIRYYQDYYAASGYDTADESFQTYLKASGMEWAISCALYRQKAAELNVAEMTAEQEAKLKEEAKAEWEEAVSYYAQETGLPENATEEEKAAARAEALAKIESTYGYTEESYVAEYVEGSRLGTLRENVQKAVIGEIAVTEEEILSHFNELVEEDKATYEGNVPMYEYYTQYMGANSYYVPEGYRGITHILLEVDSALLKNYQDLSAKLEEQQEKQTADDPAEGTAENTEAPAEAAAENTEAPAEAAAQPTEAPAEAAAENTEAPAEAAAEPTEAPAEAAAAEEPVTEEMVEAARKAIMDSVEATVKEITDKYAAGTPFADLIAEYGTDPGMTVEPNKTDGYAVHKESILWDPAFTEGAMALEKIGDISGPVLGSYGIHILHYTRDIPSGAVALTEELKASLREELLEELESAAVTAMEEEWRSQADIQLTDEGKALKAAMEEEQQESVEATEATEEALTEGK